MTCFFFGGTHTSNGWVHLIVRDWWLDNTFNMLFLSTSSLTSSSICPVDLLFTEFFSTIATVYAISLFSSSSSHLLSLCSSSHSSLRRRRLQVRLHFLWYRERLSKIKATLLIFGRQCFCSIWFLLLELYEQYPGLYFLLRLLVE